MQAHPGTLRLSGKRVICTLSSDVTRNTRGGWLTAPDLVHTTPATVRAGGAVDINSVAEELYSLPPEEFTAARNLC